jgi:hypothetical protein
VRCKIGTTLLLALVTTLSGCGGGAGSGSQDQGTPPAVSGTSVVVTPATADVYQGATLQFQVQVIGQSNQAVTWSVQDNFGTIDSTGLYTAPRDGYGGPFHVIATSQTVPSAQGSALVNVLPIQVTVTPAIITLHPGGNQSFSATVVGLTDTAVTWSIQEAGGGLITNSGFYTAPSATGFYHVVATSVADTTRNGSAIVTVTNSSSSFVPTGDMQDARGLHTATLLANGKVLVAGGTVRTSRLCLGGIRSTEVYDPAAGLFSPTGNMISLRYAHTATALPNGDVLVVGGFGSGFDCEDLGEPAQNSAELYNPSTGSFKATGSMVNGRAGHTATLLPSGKVLVVGGGNQGGGPFPFYGAGSNTAELYDPATGQFSPTGSMSVPRYGHTATLLANGKVLIVGGAITFSSKPTTVAEIYDPVAGTFSATGSTLEGRYGHSATLLPNGKILITGGLTDFVNSTFVVSSTAEIFDPATGTFSNTDQMGMARSEHTATLLPDGTVLVAGGGNPTAEIYDPAASSFGTTGSMGTWRTGHSATLLKNGRVLVAGGYFLATSELY